jgi:hypothetical protein
MSRLFSIPVLATQRLQVVAAISDWLLLVEEQACAYHSFLLILQTILLKNAKIQRCCFRATVIVIGVRQINCRQDNYLEVEAKLPIEAFLFAWVIETVALFLS